MISSIFIEYLNQKFYYHRKSGHIWSIAICKKRKKKVLYQMSFLSEFKLKKTARKMEFDVHLIKILS